MCKRPCTLMFLAFVVSLSLLGMAAASGSGLAGWWKLDETSGTTAPDSSGNGNNGALEGDVQWVEGVLNGAWQGDGAGDYIRVPHSDSLDLSEAVTVAVWLYGGIAPDQIICKGDDGAAWVSSYSIRVDDDSSHTRQINWRGRAGSTADALNSNTALPTEEWTHLAVTFDVSAPGNNQKVYINGTLDAESRSTTPLTTNTADVLIGADGYSTTRWHWQGMLDDVRLYSQALNASQIGSVIAGGGLETASAPSPGNEEIDVLRDVRLAWKAGEYAVTHDVYLGTNFDDVNDAGRDNPLDVLVSLDQAETTYDAGRLSLGQTYYWRVDEVNAAPDNTIFKGNVWSFTTEVVAYPVSGVIATTNAASEDGSGPEKMVDGSGLNASDQHSDVTTDMWQAQAGDADPVQIDFAFDKVYCLYEILVWNSNTQFETMLGFGIQNVTVEYSADGETWTVLGDVDLAEGTGMSDYTANTTIDLGGVAAQYVKFTVNSRYSDTMLFGLSEVRFLYIPAYASQPAPADGDADVSIETALAWRPGRQAVSHELYLGTDPDTLALAGIVDTATLTPDALDLATTYYWRVDEVNDAEAISLWQGDLWNFSTQEYIVIEDFESYNNDDNLIYETWIDGWYNGTGSTVGYFEAPFAETVIVHSGAQSMPLAYSNVGATTSTADFELSHDWTGNGIQSLSLFFHGSAGNTGRLYVKINDTKFSYDGEADDIAKETWLPWNIDLTTAGVNVSAVTMLSIGVEGAGTGVVYFDDLRLYPSAPESVEPIAPDDSDTSLVGLWKLDDGAGTVVTDASGNNHNGVFHGAPQWIADGVTGGALQLDGADDYVVLGSINYGDSDFSVALWVKTDGWNDDAAMVSNKDWNSGSSVGWLIAGGAGNNGSWQWNFSDGTGRADFDPSVDLCRVAGGQWHHLCVTHDRDGLAMFYYDGVLIGQQDISAISGSLDAELPTVLGTDGAEGAVWAYWFAGVFDDVRIYNRVLSNGEVAGLTGRTAPLHQGF